LMDGKWVGVCERADGQNGVCNAWNYACSHVKELLCTAWSAGC
jgi:hypothetical protein